MPGLKNKNQRLQNKELHKKAMPSERGAAGARLA